MPKAKKETEEKVEKTVEAKEKAEKKAPSKKITQQEFEKKVEELADKGLTSEKIGEMLRQEGIHSQEYDKKISKILKEKGKYVNPDLKNVGEKLRKLKEHYEKNKQDKRAKREVTRVFAQERKLKNYFS